MHDAFVRDELVPASCNTSACQKKEQRALHCTGKVIFKAELQRQLLTYRQVAISSAYKVGRNLQLR